MDRHLKAATEKIGLAGGVSAAFGGRNRSPGGYCRPAPYANNQQPRMGEGVFEEDEVRNLMVAAARSGLAGGVWRP